MRSEDYYTVLLVQNKDRAHGVVEISKSWLHAEITDVSNAALEFRMVVRIWRVPNRANKTNYLHENFKNAAVLM